MDPDERHEDGIETDLWECGACGAALLVLAGEDPTGPCQSCGETNWIEPL